MVEANELRIGNWYCLCNPMNRDDMDFAVFDNWTQALYFKAYGLSIPITPDILEKCGFQHTGGFLDSDWFYRLISLPTNHMNVTYELNLFTTDEIGRFGINLEEQYFGYCTYLHQLQNLYFALTGEELNYKP